MMWDMSKLKTIEQCPKIVYTVYTVRKDCQAVVGVSLHLDHRGSDITMDERMEILNEFQPDHLYLTYKIFRIEE